jgi:HAD superfamily hydrolase (TIGR01490 family)
MFAASGHADAKGRGLCRDGASVVTDRPTVVGVMTAAFFDVDNTLVKGSSLFLIGRGMVARGLVTRRDIVRYGLVQLRFRLRGEHLGHMRQAQDRALRLGEGLVVSELLPAGGEVYDQRVSRRLWPQTVALARAHLAAGDEVWLVSAAPVELVAIIADRLGLTGGLGTVSETHDGRWTGRLASPILHGPAKAVAVEELAQQRGLSLAACHAYSDSTNDQPLLEAVGHAHVVNPDRHLARTAKARGWTVHRHGGRHLDAAVVGLRSARQLICLGRHPA